jgi:sugar lactone lactonase YvrE
MIAHSSQAQAGLIQWDVVAADNNLGGEAPLWNGATQRLYWADPGENLVFELNWHTGQHQRICENLMVSGIALDQSGGLIFSGAAGLHLWQGPENHLVLLNRHEGNSLCFNDVAVSPAGHVYSGTYCWGPAGMEKTGELFLLTRTGYRIVDEGLELANGLTFSVDGRTLYLADSAARRIYAYDVDAETGYLSNKRVFLQVTADDGLPDGVTVDSEGFLYTALWYGGQVLRVDPEGRVERRLQLPVLQVSSVALGGVNLDELYVTTAAEAWPSDLAPPGFDFSAPNMGGSLYRLKVDVPGKPEPLASLS